jgi:hypothetical protein
VDLKPLTRFGNLQANTTALFVAAVAILIWRAPDAVFSPQFWGEDGAIFFRQQFGHAVPQLLIPYAGYLHLIPRLFAWLASLFPYRYAPLVYNLAATAVDASAIAYFARRTTFFVPAWITLAVFALMPTAGEEFGTLTNVQWFMQFALFAAAFYPKKTSISSASAKVLRCMTILTMALTGPFSIFCATIGLGLFAAHFISTLSRKQYAPVIAISRWWLITDKFNLSLISIGGVIQLCVLTFTDSRPNMGIISLRIAKTLFTDTLERQTLGSTAIPSAIFLGCMTFLLAFVGFRACSEQGTRWTIALGMLVFAGMQILGVCYEHNNPIVDAQGLAGDRYYFFAKLALWICLGAILGEGISKRLHLQVMVPLTLASILFFHPEMARRPPLENLHWKRAVEQIDQGKYPIELPINPVPWKVTLTDPLKPSSHP